MRRGLESVVMGLRQRQVSIWLPRVDVLEKVNLVSRLLRRAAQRTDTLPHKVWFRMVTWTVDNGHGDQGNERKKGKRRERKPATATTVTCLRQSRSPIHSAHSNLGHSALAASRECTKGRISSQEANPAWHQSFRRRENARLYAIRIDRRVQCWNTLSIPVCSFNPIRQTKYLPVL